MKLSVRVDLERLLRALSIIEDHDGETHLRKRLVVDLTLYAERRAEDLSFQPGIRLFWATLAERAGHAARVAARQAKETRAKTFALFQDQSRHGGVKASIVRLEGDVLINRRVIEADICAEAALFRHNIMTQILEAVVERGRILGMLNANERRDPHFMTGAWPSSTKQEATDDGLR